MSELVGWVLFDDACGICRVLAERSRRVLGKRGLLIEPLQAPWVGRALGIREADLLRDVRLLLPDGRQINGADVYRFVLKSMWWTEPLYLLSIVPGVRLFFDRSYRFIADHRHLISHSCPSHEIHA